MLETCQRQRLKKGSIGAGHGSNDDIYRSKAGAAFGWAAATCCLLTLVFSPELVLMDEPLGALDKQLREHMQYEIKHIHENLGYRSLCNA